MEYIADLSAVDDSRKNKEKVIEPGKSTNECVALVKHFTGAPQTEKWNRGEQVKNNNEIKPGTAIATFKKYNSETKTYSYISKSGSHAAIYIGQDANGIQVYDQWSGIPVQIRTIRWNNPINGDSNNGDAFYVIK